MVNTTDSTQDADFTIDNLAPGNSKNSNVVTATVSTNSVAGYTLNAAVGDSTNYNNTDLNPASGSDKFEMIGSSATALSAGTWGMTLDSGATYKALAIHSASNPTPLNKTTDASGTAASGYGGTANTAMQIGAHAKTSQVSGAYRNVITFAAVANMAAHTITLSPGTNVASAYITAVDGTAVTPVTGGAYADLTALTIEATCTSGYTFSGWNINYDYGAITDKSLANTTYTVGPGDVTLTPYCLLASS